MVMEMEMEMLEIGEGRIEKVPSEVMVEIMSRLPIDTAFESRCVCQNWHNLINNHCRRLSILDYNQTLVQNPNPTNLLIISTHWGKSVLHYIPNFDNCSASSKSTSIILNNLPFKSWLSKFSVVGSCNGFVCLTESILPRSWKGIVCNPVSGDWFKLPITPIPDLTYYHDTVLLGFGYTSKTNQYKVVRVPTTHVHGDPTKVTTGNFDLPVEIVTVGRDSSWRSLGPVPTMISTMVFKRQRFGVFLQGCLHWLIFDDQMMLVGIWAFDVEEETFTIVSVPDNVKHKINSDGLLYLVVLEGCLTMVDYSDKHVHQIWVMKEYGVDESWILSFSIPTPAMRGSKFQSSGMLRPLGVQNNGKVVVEFDANELFSYDPRDGTLQKLTVDGLPWAFRAVPHVGTMVSFKDVVAT